MSQICAFTRASPTRMVRVENSTPMVVRLSWLNSLRVKRERRLVFPTPDSPIRTTARKEQSSHKESIYPSHPSLSCPPSVHPSIHPQWGVGRPVHVWSGTEVTYWYFCCPLRPARDMCQPNYGLGLCDYSDDILQNSSVLM